jgi:divinyl chlorophyllide a 8-vinyl-reductase
MNAAPCKNVLVFGGSGTAGRAAIVALLQAGHTVTCFGRTDPEIGGVTMRLGDLSAIDDSAFVGFDAVVSCLASRSGAPADAWKIDHSAQSSILKSAQAGGVEQFILLSAICVQKPLLGFQQAKLAFEAELTESKLTYSIVRPTAFFKSLSGQIDRVKSGKPFLLFGDGTLTACKPISDRDLGTFIASCLTDPDKANRILPIGGPGPAVTPRAQGGLLFELTGLKPKFKQVPVAMMTAIIKGLDLAGLVSQAARDKAELARIGRYYATESMLVWDGTRYDADATPSFGSDSLRDHYAGVLSGDIVVDRGDHAVF